MTIETIGADVANEANAILVQVRDAGQKAKAEADEAWREVVTNRMFDVLLVITGALIGYLGHLV